MVRLHKLICNLRNSQKKKKLPMLPERATISFAVNPLFEKADIRSLRSIFGDGRSLFAAEKLAVVESLLPN